MTAAGLIPSAGILVVGGGISGLTFGVAASRVGLDVLIVERAKSVTTGAAGIGLHLNAQRALRSIDLADRVESVATKLDGYHVVNGDEQEIAYAPFVEVWGAPTWAVHRADLNNALRSGLSDDRVRVGVSVVDVRPEPEGAAVSFSDGSSHRYDLVIGADGVHSVVRTAALGGGHTQYGGAYFWRTTLPERIVDRATAYFRGAATVGLIPLTANRTHAFFQVPAEDPPHDEVTGRAIRVRGVFGGTSSTVDRALTLLPLDADIHFGILEWVEPPTWGKGRVVLIGDAAHSMAPPLALGGAMAIEDAVVLAEELGRADQVPDAIDRFIARRDPRVTFVQERTRITWAGSRGEQVAGEPPDITERSRRNFLPLLDDP